MDTSTIWDDLDSGELQGHRTLLAALITSTSRWRKIALTTVPRQYLVELRCVSAPLLQDLQIVESRYATEWLDLFTLRSVRRLSLQGYILCMHAPQLVNVFSHITHLSFSASVDDRSYPSQHEGIPGGVFVGILKDLAHIISLEAYINNDRLHATEVTNLPLLESLSLHARSINLPVLDNFLAHLIMPKLCNLRIAASRPPPLLALIISPVCLLSQIKLPPHPAPRYRFRRIFQGGTARNVL
ncbi:hypothetical protein C8R43DRAFT_1131303 [Mycena crocata]|nr:hypothetical protein C8R43DRAFT_1131303 [Mycena crocata]